MEKENILMVIVIVFILAIGGMLTYKEMNIIKKAKPKLVQKHLTLTRTGDTISFDLKYNGDTLHYANFEFVKNGWTYVVTFNYDSFTNVSYTKHIPQ